MPDLPQEESVRVGGFYLTAPFKVLIVDDDPSHLEIYGLLIQQAGLQPVSALIRFLGIDIPKNEQISLVLLDYKLHSLKSSAEIAQDIRNLYPSVPIVLLSDMWSLPADIEPYVSEFVRKGQPGKLLETVRRLVPHANGPLSGSSPAEASPEEN